MVTFWTYAGESGTTLNGSVRQYRTWHQALCSRFPLHRRESGRFQDQCEKVRTEDFGYAV